MPNQYWWRSFKDKLMVGLAGMATLLVLLPLVAIFAYLVYRGIGALNWNFLTKIPKHVGESGGGMANVIDGLWLFLLITCINCVHMYLSTSIMYYVFGYIS